MYTYMCQNVHNGKATYMYMYMYMSPDVVMGKSRVPRYLASLLCIYTLVA